MQYNEPMTVGIPTNIYEALEDALEGQIYKLGIEIAKTLNVDSKILMKEFKKEKIKIYTFEDNSDINIHCKSYTQNKEFYIPCKHPIVYGEQYCINHLINHIVPPEGSSIASVLYDDNIIYYRNIKNNVVYDSEGVLFGRWNIKTQKIDEFIIDQ
jgi:hypothetical protein